MKNYVIRAVAEKNISVFLAITTNMVEEARQTHLTTPVATAALGRTITVAAMMGLMLKGEKNKISIQVKGNGPLKQILAVADSRGNVKGYVSDPTVDLPLRADNKLDVGRAVGKEGKIVVIKDLGLKEPYIGQLELVSGEIAEDIASYYAISEQQPSAVALGVVIDKDHSVKIAGGFIIQVLPDAEEILIDRLENRIKSLPAITSIIEEGLDGEEMLNKILEGFEFEILEKNEIRYNCDCSEERLEKALISVGRNELKEIIQKDGEAELTCHFCNTVYKFHKEHLEKLYSAAQ